MKCAISSPKRRQQFVQQRLAIGKVIVERALRHACRLGDPRDRGFGITQFADDLGRSIEQPLPHGGVALGPGRLADGRSDAQRPSSARSDAQLALEHLARGAAGERCGKDHPVGHLEAGKLAAAVDADFVLAQPCVRLDHDHGHRPFAPALVRRADDRAVLHLRQLLDHPLDFGRGDVLSARDDHVLHPVGEGQEALLVEHPGIAGAQPVAPEAGGSLFRGVPVARRSLWPRAGRLRLPRRAARRGRPRRGFRYRLAGSARPTEPILSISRPRSISVSPPQVSVRP